MSEQSSSGPFSEPLVLTYEIDPEETFDIAVSAINGMDKRASRIHAAIMFFLCVFAGLAIGASAGAATYFTGNTSYNTAVIPIVMTIGVVLGIVGTMLSQIVPFRNARNLFFEVFSGSKTAQYVLRNSGMTAHEPDMTTRFEWADVRSVMQFNNSVVINVNAICFYIPQRALPEGLDLETLQIHLNSLIAEAKRS